MTILYSNDHEWIDTAGPESAVVGITLHAQEALGDVVYVGLPAIGTRLERGAVAGVVESVKAAADLVMPVSGEVTEVNEALRADPSLANTDPMHAGWFFKVRLADASQLASLLDTAAYDALTKSA